MKKFEFSLERLLGFKRSMYEKERNALAQLRVQRLALEAKKEETQRQIAVMEAEFREKAANGVKMDEVNRLSFHQTNAGRLIEQLDVDIEQMDVLIQRQLEVVIQLDKDVKGLEKLRETQWDEYTAEAMKAEQERILELVSGRFIEDQKSGEGQ